MWRKVITTAYEPEFLYERFAYNMQHTYPNRIKPPLSPARLSKKNIRKGLWILGNLIVRIGILSNYRKTFWKMAGPKLKAGKIENLIHIGLVGHHLITFAQECAQGKQSASFYSQRIRAPLGSRMKSLFAR
jgi:hypothetical protein